MSWWYSTALPTPPLVLDRIADLAGCPLQLVEGDIRDLNLDRVFTDSSGSNKPIEAVIHLAGLKAVGESVTDPLRYWDVNLGGTCNLLAAMQANSCNNLVFSSSATLYGYPETVPISESAKINPINPYGRSKAAVEQVLRDVFTSAPKRWRSQPALLQSSGSSPLRAHGRRPQRHPQQSVPFRKSSGNWPPQAAASLWRRLANTRRQWSAGLHPRNGSRRGPPRGLELFNGSASPAFRSQPRERTWSFSLDVVRAFVPHPLFCSPTVVAVALVMRRHRG